VPRPRTLLNVVLFGVVVAFIGWTASDLAARWQQSPNTEVSIGWLAASILPICVVSLCQGFAWVSLVRHLAQRPVPLRPGLELLFASMLGRYVPAKLGMAAVLVTSAGRIGQPAPLLLSAMVIQALVYTLLGLGMGVAAISLSEGQLPPAIVGLRSDLGVVALVGLVLGIGVLTVVDRSRYPARVRDKLGVGGSGPLINVAHIGWLVIVWIGWWAHGAMVVVAVGGTWTNAVDVAGFFVLAPVIGFVALVSPGGLGVREAVVAIGLAPAVGGAGAAIAAIVARVVSLGVDVAMWAAFRFRRGAATASPADAEDPAREARR